MKKSIIALTILASLLTGCASDAEKMAQDQLALEQARRDGAAEARAQLTAQMEEEMAEVVPSWYLDPPKMDGTGVYGVGTAHTKDLGFAVRKAKLVAIYEAAKVFKMEMSGQERSMTRDAGDEGEVADRTELLIDALVARVPVSGYDIVKTNVKPYEGQFHAYVLAKITFDEYNSVMKNNKDELKGEFDGAFQALEARLNEREARAQASTVTPTQPGGKPAELASPLPNGGAAAAPQTPAQANAEIASMVAGDLKN